MSITSSGALCDVCDKYILPLPDGMGGEEMVNTFSVKGMNRDCHCHNKCKQLVIDAGIEWQKLPDGPLRKVFIERA